MLVLYIKIRKTDKTVWKRNPGKKCRICYEAMAVSRCICVHYDDDQITDRKMYQKVSAHCLKCADWLFRMDCIMVFLRIVI